VEEYCWVITQEAKWSCCGRSGSRLSFDFHWTPMHKHIWLTACILNSNLRKIQLVLDHPKCNYCIRRELSVCVLNLLAIVSGKTMKGILCYVFKGWNSQGELHSPTIEDECTTLSQDANIRLPNDAVSYPRRTGHAATPPLKPQNLKNLDVYKNIQCSNDDIDEPKQLRKIIQSNNIAACVFLIHNIWFISSLLPIPV